LRKLLGAFALLLSLLGSGCASLSQAQHARAVQIAQDARSQVIDCQAANACAEPSPLRDLADRARADSTAQVPRHYALLLDRGEDSLLARLNLIRAARRSIDVQTYIFDTDDSARLVLDELLAAARRGVRVRVLIDQLTAIPDLDMLAALSGAHRNFALRIYNPTFNRATWTTRPACCAASAASTSACTPSCCWWTTRSASPAGATTRTTITTGIRNTTSATATC
jgi:phosphatidylserine/phosphatidylglycerophosphate/cardiolipin synthase-like enzyme